MPLYGRLSIATVLALSLAARSARACASAMPREGAAKPVEIKREEALIVWNEATKEEHFIRRAVFDARVKSFGFLVPTPTRPTLAEVAPSLFDDLARITKPEVREESRWDVEPGTLCISFFARGALKSAAAPERAAVEVLEETHVGGMEATVLSASDPEALAKWLGERDFDLRPALVEWLKPYVAAKFVITAFRYARPDVAAAGAWGAEAPLSPTAVRLTFAAERPFYPYREPPDAPAVFGRALHVFLITDSRAEGTLEGRWATASTLYADRLVPSAALAAAVPGVAIPPNAWLTEIVDLASSRPQNDVYFAPSPERAAVHPPPDVRITASHSIFLPLDVLAIVAAALVLRYRRRRGRPSEPV